MKLYHGTTESNARRILRDGLQPRATSGEKGNWDHSEPSVPTHVYLTSVYGVYFATCAAHDDNERAAIIEIDTDKIDQTLLRPDEDFVTFALCNDPKALKKLRLDKLPTAKIHDFVRRNIDRYRDWWEQSIKFLGNVSYCGTIEPFAITRIAPVDYADKFICMNALNPTISVMNFKYCERRYRALTKYVMADPVTAEEMMDVSPVEVLELGKGESEYGRMRRESLEAVAQCIAGRNTQLIYEATEDSVLQSVNHSN